MASTVSLNAIATCRRDLEENVHHNSAMRFLFPCDDQKHRQMEYLWGLEICTIDPTHEKSILHVRRSMAVSLPNGEPSWALLPTAETIAAMTALQTHNFTVPIAQRKSFLVEFPAEEYEYIFVPLSPEVDFFIQGPGKSITQLRAPFTTFPRVMASANPFFVAFDSRILALWDSVAPSAAWRRAFMKLTMHWCHDSPPEEFLLTSYPVSFYSESEDETEIVFGASKSGSDETITTPLDTEGDEDSYFFPDKVVVPGDFIPPTPRGDRTRAITACKKLPQWRVESRRGLRYFERHFPAAAAQFRATGL
ncbi:hypothetical protein R3P38DRAFT_3054737 [Favolaschia claudopus]|uniref:Uncharacterized protein n=1 Tax=Favolaschia claudopus TaxID=2862362 RepID=A0AAW0A3V9_9AGAR